MKNNENSLLEHNKNLTLNDSNHSSSCDSDDTFNNHNNSTDSSGQPDYDEFVNIDYLDTYEGSKVCPSACLQNSPDIKYPLHSHQNPNNINIVHDTPIDPRFNNIDYSRHNPLEKLEIIENINKEYSRELSKGYNIVTSDTKQNNLDSNINITPNVLTQDHYQYELYNEYMEQMNKYLFNSNKNSLSIKYYHTNINSEKGNYNFDDETGARHDVVTSKFNYLNSNKYTIYEFTPTNSMSTSTYQINTDEIVGTNMITTGTITIYSIVEPLNGDLFHLYSKDKAEVFKITSINFNRTANTDVNMGEKDAADFGSLGLKLYECTFESSHIPFEDLQKSTSNNTDPDSHNFFINEFDIYFNATEFKNYKYLIENQTNIIKTLNDCYDSSYCEYIIFEEMTFKLDKELAYLNKLLNNPNLKPDIEPIKILKKISDKNKEKDIITDIKNKFNNTIKFLNKNVPSFNSKIQPYHKINYNAFKMIDNITDVEIATLEKIYENLNDKYKEEYNNSFEKVKMLKDLYENYHPFLYKCLIENEFKMW